LVEGFATATGTFSVFMSCGAAAKLAKGIVTCGSTVTRSTVGEPSTFGQPSGEVIYAVRAPATKTFRFRTCNSNFDTFARLINGNGVDIKACDDSSDCACGSVCCSNNLRSSLQSSISANSNSFILVEGFETATGSVSLAVTCS
jgi:hypothetical protein